eukprot:258603-Amphidinium_carterae.1
MHTVQPERIAAALRMLAENRPIAIIVALGQGASMWWMQQCTMHGAGAKIAPSICLTPFVLVRKLRSTSGRAYTCRSFFATNMFTLPAEI